MPSHGISPLKGCKFHHLDKARIFLLVDLREIFFRFRVGGTEKEKKSSENDQLTGHFQSLFFFFFFSELFFFQSFFFFNISKKNSKTSKVILKYFIIFLKIWTGQSLLTVSLSKMHRQNLKKSYFFSTKQIIFRVGG